MKFFVRTLLVVCLTWLFLTAIAFSQNVAAGSRDDSFTSLKAPQPPRATAKPGGAEAEGDDATARMFAQRKQSGIPTADFKRKLLQERARRQSADRAARAGYGPSTVAGPTWIPIGPEGADYESNGGFSGEVRDSGRARTILPHPTDPDTLYFLTSGGGLWVTHNFTSPNTTWTPLTDSLPTTTGGAVAFGRTPNVLYLGLGDPFDVINIGGAMVKSIDGGQNWGPVFDLGSALSVRDILVDTSGADDIVLVASSDGLYRSTDSGVTYTQIQGGAGELFQGQVIWSLARTSAGIIANAQPCTGIGDGCATVGGLYVSTDLGATWAPIPNGGNVYALAGRATLAVGAPGDAIVYAFAEKGNVAFDQLDLFRSTDGGLNWTALGLNTKAPTNPNSDNPNMDLMHGQAWYNQMILVDPRDATRNTVYLGGNLSSGKTTDGGVTWTLLSNWLYPSLGDPRFGLPYVHADFHAAAISLAGTPTLLFGNDGGIFVSTDEGASWSSDKNNGLQTHLLYSISSTPGYPENVIGGFQDNGTRVRKGDTKIYNQSLGGDGIAATWSQGNTNMSITTLPGGSYGANLTNQIPDLIAPWFRFSVTTGGGLFFAPITIPSPAIAPSGRIFYSATAARVFWLDMDANPLSVHFIATPGTGGIPATRSFRAPVHGIGVSPVDLLHIGVPAASGFLDLTSNGGVSWSDIDMNAAVPGFQSSIESVTYVDNSTIYVTSVAPFAGAVRVAKSINGGATWAAANSGLPDVQVERIIVDPSDVTKQTLLAATYAGVYRSTDGGANWAPYGTGLPSVSVRDIYMPPDGSFVRIATYGRGFWELPSLAYVGSTLTDDVTSCDHDGSLDNGETGHLTITLHNDSSSALTSITGTVTSTNPAVSFPSGNSLTFPAAAGNSDTTTSITVALNGAAGIQQADFTIAFTDPALGLPSPATAVASFRANTDLVPSANDSFEAAVSPWTVTGLAEVLPDTLNWRHIQITPLEHRWLGLDSNANTDQSLVSPVMHVGSGPFTFSFEHRFRFEFSGTQFYDGYVLELSTNGGSSWTDIGAAAVPTYNHVLLAADDNVLSGRPAYSGTSSSGPAPFTPVTVNLGTTYAGQDVKIRFRLGTDTAGFGPGVDIRNFTTSGLTNTPFMAVVADDGLCPTATTVSSDHNPSNFGDLVTFGAAVSGGYTVATGTVTFSDGASVIGSGTLDGSGQTSFATSALAAGSHSIKASYGGDSGHAVSESTVLSQSVQQIGTTTTVASTLNPSVFGQSVTFNATVSTSAGPATGTVTFFDGASSLGTVAVSGGTASLTTSALAVGSHPISATYSGDVNHSGSSGSLSQMVNPASSSVALSADINPAVFGQTVMLTAAVSPQFGGTATGTVTFSEGATTLGTSAVSGNSAALNVNLEAGTHSLKATYSGDGNVSGSTSPALSEKVNKATTSVNLTSSANPALVGQSVTYTATVVPQVSGTPSGTVNFKQGTVVVGTGILSGGVATFTTSYSSTGTVNLKASYTGDSNFLSSTSAVLKEVINKSAVTITVASDVNPSVYGQSVTFTATLATSGSTLDGQTVTFKLGQTILGTATISGGAASVSTAALNAGNRTVTASYAGDASHSAVSGSVTQVVQKVSTTTVVTSDVNPSSLGQVVTFTATVSSGAAVPTGTVKFKSGATVLATVPLSGGVATFQISTLPAGSTKITVSYTPTSNFTSSSGSVVQQVQ